jgi:FkbM family methyltransferase
MTAPATNSIARSFPFRLGFWLLHIRPAPLAVALKRLLGLRRREVRTESGTFWLDPVSDPGQCVAQFGNYDPSVSALLRRVLRPGDTFIDVGANEGFISVLAAQLVGPAGRVVAVEPQARLQPVLRRNFELNHVSAELCPVALPNRAGAAELQLAPDTNNSSTGFTNATRYRLARQSVETLTLTDLLTRLNIATPFVLKIDIEGWEHEAVFGSQEIFRRQLVRALILELHPSLLRARGLAPEAIPDFLATCGYDHLPDSRGCVWVPVRPAS